jgi:hypothetical protein
MSRYFSISNGLRGCYMPDSASIVRVDTRKELKALVTYEAQFVLNDGDKGGSKKAIAAVVASTWRDRSASLPYCLTIKPAGSGSYHYGLFIGNATRAEYLANEEES